MTTFTKQIQINTSSNEVWKVVSNLGDIYKFHPGVSKSYYTTDQLEGIGAARVCELLPAGKIKETALSWNEGEGYILQIDPLEKAPPVKNFTGEFKLNSFGKNTTQVSLTVKYNMKLGVIGNLLNKLIIQLQIEKGIDGLLKGLKLHMEQGVEVKNNKTLLESLQTAV